MFNIGDKVRAIKDAPYHITTDGWTGTVLKVSGDCICVRKSLRDLPYWVDSTYFQLVKIEEENKMNVNEIITEKEREMLLKDMKGLLDEYDYNYSDDALNKIIDTWAEDKADLITAFKKHPNYLEGKFMIAFNHNFDRTVDINIIRSFVDWLISYDVSIGVRDFMPKDMREYVVSHGCKYPYNIYMFLCKLVDYTEQYIETDIADLVNEIYPDARAREGQKMSRIVNKICDYIGLTKMPDYNKEFAKYADAINPLQIVRHTILSVNPLDYLTMSFGNSWASCHTIDKTNKRGMPNSYEGMYSSGTVSYMLDGTSMVFYTVDAAYDGNDFWHEPKINRQMFHWGKEKLIQGRLYPQDNDNHGEVYKPYREIVQKIMSELFDFPNYWTVKKGTAEASKYVESEGTHYRDYENYSNCNLSIPKGSENEETIIVGHDPICIRCGKEHSTADNINCCSSKYTCADCGCAIEDEDDVIYIDGETYCRDCVNYCNCCNEYTRDDVTYIESEDRYVCDDCLNEYYEYCTGCDEYVDRDDMTYVESEDECYCRSCLEDNFCTCGRCMEIFRNRVMTEFDNEELCPDCLEEAKAEVEEDTEEFTEEQAV